MDTTNDTRVPDEPSPDEAGEARILNPFLFNLQGADGTHGFSLRKAAPHLTLVNPDEDEEDDAAPACLRIREMPAEVVLAVEAHPVEAAPADATVAAAPQAVAKPLSVIEWAGGDRKAWRCGDANEPALFQSKASLTPSQPPPPVAASLASPIVPVLPVGPQRAVNAPPNDAPRVEPIAAQQWAAEGESVAGPSRWRTALHAARAQLRMAGLWAGRAFVRARHGVPEAMSKTRNALRAIISWRPPSLDMQRRGAAISAAIRTWVAARMNRGWLAEFRWFLMFKWAGGTAACGIVFIMMMRTILT